MCSLAIILCTALVAVSAAPASVDVLKFSNIPYDNERGQYEYTYELSDGTATIQRGEVRNRGSENEYIAVVGEYTWIAPNGIPYKVKYEADENGYNSELEEGPPGSPFGVASALIG